MSRLIFSNLAAKSEHVAISADGRSLSYRELNAECARLASEIHVKKGSTVGLLAPSGLEYVLGLLAIWRAGGIAVPLQPAHPLAELHYIIENAGCEIVLAAPALVTSAQGLVGPENVHPIGLETSMTRQEMPAAFTPEDDDGALIIYTSGTTRKPKGVLSTHGVLHAQMSSLIEAWKWSETDRTVNVLPLHHVHGIVNILCCSLAAGAHCEMRPKFDAEEVWNRLASRECTVFMAVPTVYTKLVECAEKAAPAVLARWLSGARSLRLMVSGSAALPVPLFEKWHLMTGHKLLERYGMTEIGMALSNPYQGERRSGRVGQPLPGVDVRLVDDSGAVIETSETPGELQVKGRTVFREYWGLPEITQESFTKEGWFKTGDMSEFDQFGSFRILGRLSQDIIKSGGYKISALEIESVLLEHPAVGEVAVLGLADEKWGERVAAVYVLKADVAVSETELKKFASDRLAHYKVPTLWKKVEVLPRNAMGKVMKPSVRSLFSTP